MVRERNLTKKSSRDFRYEHARKFYLFTNSLAGTCSCELFDLIRDAAFSENAFTFRDLKKLWFDAKFFKLDKNELSICIDSMLYLNCNGYSFEKVRNQFYYNNNVSGYFLYASFLQKYCHYCKLRKTIIGKKIYPKYPEDVFEELSIMQHHVDFINGINNKVSIAAEKIKWMETKITHNGQKYNFTVPDSYEKIIEEADALKICVASRKDQFISGEMIFVFMRKAESDIPYVSIIMKGYSGEVIWAITEYHKDLEGENREVLNKYINKMKVKKKKGNFSFPYKK